MMIHKNTILVLAAMAVGVQAFAPASSRPLVRIPTTPQTKSQTMMSAPPAAPFRMASTSVLPDPSQQQQPDEAERLRTMAAKLRQEAASLEAEQKATIQQAAQKIFRRFDTDGNGSIDVAELQKGLAKLFKVELPESRAAQLIQAFDTNRDGSLQLEEFVGVDAMRNKLESLLREERQAAREQTKAAQAEAEALALAEKRMGLVNDKPPTATDRIVSVLPYAFPLLDGLAFSRFFIEGNPENPLAVAALVAYTLYRSIPFGGLLSFFGLTVLSENPKLNKLVRFNLQQAVSLDVALYAPALFAALGAGLLNQLGVSIPENVVELSNDAVFLGLLATLGYATVSSLSGEIPNKIPFLSKRVEDRMITADMFDEEGRFAPFDEEGNLKKPKSNKDDDEKKD